MDDQKKRDRTEDTGPYELSLDDTLVQPPAEGIDSLFEDAVEAVEKRRGKAVEAEDPAESATESKAGSKAEPKSQPKADPPSDGNGIPQAATEDAEKMRERLLRAMADFDNYRKRTEREKSDLRRQAAGSVLRDMLEVVDNLERALSASGKLDELKQGVEMILRQQVDILRRHGVERVESVGRPFDPNIHEAVAREEGGGELEVPTVATELQAGYRHHDRLLRPAMVTVAVPPAKGRKDVREAVADLASEGNDGDSADFDYDDEHTVIGIDV